MAVSTSAPSVNIRDEVAALKRERTIAAAVELFYKRGYENTTLDAVAERIGVTKPFIYAHFASKAELLAEICGRGIASAVDAMNKALQLRCSPTERLQILGRGFVTAVLENQKHIAIFTREEKNLAPQDLARISAMRREFDRKLTSLLAEGVAAGEFHVADPKLAALAIGGMVSWAYVWYREDGRLSLPKIAEDMSALMLSMAEATPKPTPNGATERADPAAHAEQPRARRSKPAPTPSRQRAKRRAPVA